MKRIQIAFFLLLYVISLSSQEVFNSPDVAYDFKYDGSSICFDKFNAEGHAFDIQIRNNITGAIIEGIEFEVNSVNGHCFDLSHLDQSISYTIIINDERFCESTIMHNCSFNTRIKCEIYKLNQEKQSNNLYILDGAYNMKNTNHC